jgi:1-acyl-sn-glycerol-3-phosphate acyltransferase
MAPRTTTINPPPFSRAPKGRYSDPQGSASSFRQLPRHENRVAIRILFALDTLFARIYHHLKVIQPCQIPLRGPAILACNHTSSIDPAFIQAVCRNRLITWMMAREYMDIKGTGWFYRTLGAIPVERSGRDTTPLRAAIRALEAGQILGVFPEGKIAKTAELLPFQTGVALMAIKTGAPVYPAYLTGTQRNKEMLDAVLYRNEATISFGYPVEFDRSTTTKENLESTTSAIREAVGRLAIKQI